MNLKLSNIYLNYPHTYSLKENIRFELTHGAEQNYEQKIENGKKEQSFYLKTFLNMQKLSLGSLLIHYNYKQGRLTNTCETIDESTN